MEILTKLLVKTSKYTSAQSDVNKNIALTIEKCFSQGPEDEISIVKWSKPDKKIISKKINCQRVIEFLILNKQEKFKELKKPLYLSKFKFALDALQLSTNGSLSSGSVDYILSHLRQYTKKNFTVEFNKVLLKKHLFIHYLEGDRTEKELLVNSAEEQGYFAEFIADLNIECLKFFEKHKVFDLSCDFSQTKNDKWFVDARSGPQSLHNLEKLKKSIQLNFLNMITEVATKWDKHYYKLISDQPILLYLSDSIFESAEEWLNSNKAFESSPTLDVFTKQYVYFANENDLSVQSEVKKFLKLVCILHYDSGGSDDDLSNIGLETEDEWACNMPLKIKDFPVIFTRVEAYTLILKDYLKKFHNPDQFKMVLDGYTDTLLRWEQYWTTLEEQIQQYNAETLSAELKSYVILIAGCFVPVFTTVKVLAWAIKPLKKLYLRLLKTKSARALACSVGSIALVSYHMGSAYVDFEELFNASHSMSSIDTNVDYEGMAVLSEHLSLGYFFF